MSTLPELASEISERWPPIKKALFTAICGEQLNDGHYINAYELTDRLYAVLGDPDKFREWVLSAPVSSGVCCCGENMDNHSDPMSCGHTPVDQWDYSLSQWKMNP